MLRARLILIGFVSVLFAGVFAGSIYAIEPDEVVGIWFFDEGTGNVAKDSSGNGYDGEIRPDVKWDNGKFGKALRFPGTVDENSYVTIPHQDSLNLVEHSIAAWIKVTPTEDDWQIIMSKWNPHSVRNYSLLTNKGDGRFFAQFTSGEGQYKTARPEVSVTDDQWYHVACTYDGAFLRAYVNGEKGAEIATGPGDPNDGELTIGARWGGTHPTTGLIDDVGLFSVALEDDEIKEIMEKGLANMLGITAVEPGDKLAITWGEVKAD